MSAPTRAVTGDDYLAHFEEGRKYARTICGRRELSDDDIRTTLDCLIREGDRATADGAVLQAAHLRGECAFLADVLIARGVR